MSSGALVFVDPLYVPHPFPMEHGVHVIHFDNHNMDDLHRKLDYYRAHPAEAAAIARRGYLHALTHHRTVNAMDYILRTVHVKTLLASHVATNDGQFHTFCKEMDRVYEEKGALILRHHRYQYTGQSLNEQAKRQIDKGIIHQTFHGNYTY